MKRLSRVLVTMMIAVMLITQVASAKTVDVTALYQSQVNEMLGHFDSVFGYACANGAGFKFNIYTRSVMLLHSDLIHYQINGNTKKAKKVIKPLMKKYFKKKKVAFHKYKGLYYPDVSWLWTDNNGTLRYRMGNWGLVAPEGRVLSIIQQGKKKLIATYQIRWHDWEDNTDGDEMGVFTVIFKHKSGRYYISDIKRTRTSNCFI